ncbi:helicase HerA domain-containing protein [Pyrobaculum islandicum]|nr:ATP-binding protein [Pyrobaculum islandicum]
MRIGYVVATATPFEFIATLDPERPVSLYDYVAVDHVEYDATNGEYINVRLLGQIVKLFRDPYSAKRDLPLYSVMKEVSDNILEVQIAKVKVLGYIYNGELRQPKHPPRIGTPVYLAENEEIAELFKIDGGLCVGRLASRDLEICLDLNGVKRHVAVIAATGSGKTWFSVVFIEELLKKGAKIVVVDPHGEYVPIKDSIYKLGPYSATVVKLSKHHVGDLMYKIGVLDSDPDALANAAGVPPGAKKIRYAIYLAWSYAKKVKKTTGKALGLSFLRQVLHTALRGETALNKLFQQYKVEGDFPMEDLKQLAKKDRHSIFSALMYLKKLQRLGVFSSKSTPLSKILADITIVNLAGVNEEVQDYVVSHIVNRIFQARVRHVRSLKGLKIPWPVVLVVEEAHRFAPPKTLRKTKSYEALSRVASEGRKFGVYLVIVSQRPSKVDPDVISQCQSQVIMRIVNPKDQEAVRESSELLAQEFLENLPGLDVGEAVVLGPLTRLPVVIRLRDRVLEYGGADIDLAKVWRIDKTADVLQLWRRIYNTPPSPSVILSASRLKILHKRRERNRIEVLLLDGDREVSVVIEDGRPICSVCGVGKPCPHVYKALEEAVEII